MKKLTLIDAIMPDLLPKIEGGISGGVHLEPKDCQDLLRVLSVSVPLETVMDFCADLIHNTLKTKGEYKNDDSTDG